VVHFDGFYASVYFATFPSEYLHTIRNVNVDTAWEEKVKLHHTRRYNLFNRNDRTEFIKQFVALLRFTAAGEANIGHLRKDGDTIHRAQDDFAEILHPPQEAMDEVEEARWRTLSASQYTD
jgi:hypothetical protein